MSRLLNAEAEVEQAIWGVRLSVGSFHLSDETTESITQLSSGAPKNILLQLHGTSWSQETRSQIVRLRSHTSVSALKCMYTVYFSLGALISAGLSQITH